MSKKYPGGFITKSPVAPTNAAAKGVWSLTEAANYTKQGIWPATPGTPTIGTATVASATSVSVAFTPPTNLGAGTVTYTATSSPSGITGTGASSPVTVSGLSTGTAYTFTVTAATPGGTSPASAASNSATPALPAIGSAYEGGFYAGQISTAGNGVADYNLVVGPLSAAQSFQQWKTARTDTAGTNSNIDGPTNSSNMNDASHPAAQFCEGLSIGGFSDWYMPARNEVEICYYNFKPTTVHNNTGTSTSNPNAVPPRASNYSQNIPAQTSVAAFQAGGSQAFSSAGAASAYWGSTENGSAFAWAKSFNNGSINSYYKTTEASVRAIRRVAV